MGWFWRTTTYSPGNREVRYPVTWLANTPKLVTPGDYARQFDFDGRQNRHYLFHVPYRVLNPAPVVLVLHGGGGSASLAHLQSEMDAVSDRNGFIAVYPAGTNSEDTQERLYWNTGRPMRRGFLPARDVEFIARVLADLRRYAPVNQSRVFATGISNGAQMCFRLAAELPIKAIAPICGWMKPDELAVPPDGPIPMLVIAGDKDTYAPILGGGEHSPGSPFRPYTLPPLDDAMAAWGRFNGMRAATKKLIVPNNGHCWPGGAMTYYEEFELKLGPLNDDVPASALAWEFFKTA